MNYSNVFIISINDSVINYTFFTSTIPKINLLIFNIVIIYKQLFPLKFLLTL